MTTKHTPDRMTSGDARRMVAAWNACDGIRTEDLEAGPPIHMRLEASRNLGNSMQAEMLAAQRQRDELLKELEAIRANEDADGDVLREQAHCAIEAYEDDAKARRLGLRT